jgi:hypothetical protein
MLNTFWAMCYTRWKLQIFTKSRTITLQILNKLSWKYPITQLCILMNIPVTFHDPRLNTFWASCDTSWKLQIYTKSRAITLTKHNKSTCETPGAQLHIVNSIHVRFHDSRSNTFRVTCDTSWKLQMFIKSMATTLKILNKSTWKYPAAQLHMLINIPVKFHYSRSNTFELRATQKRTDGRTEGKTDGRTDKGKSKCHPPPKVGAQKYF